MPRSAVITPVGSADGGRGVCSGHRSGDVRAVSGDPPGTGAGGSTTAHHLLPENRDANDNVARIARSLPERARDPPSRASVRAGRLVTGVLMISPPVALAIAVPLLWGHAVSLLDIILAAAFYVVTGFGIAVGYHRLFTHRSFRAVRWLKILLASTGSMAVEGSVVGWVAIHRRHHVFSDKPGDPHSPHEYGPGPAAQLRGFARARRLVVQGRSDVGGALRTRSPRRRRHDDHQPAVPDLRGRVARGAVLPRLDDHRRAQRRAHRVLVGRVSRA